MDDLQKPIVLTGSVNKEIRELSINEDVDIPEESIPPGLAITATVDGHNLHLTFNEDVALVVDTGDKKQRPITFKELTLSNKFALEALVMLLVDKKIIEVKELEDTMNKVRQAHFRGPQDAGEQ